MKASSLVETIVATVISTICMSIAVLVFVQVSSNSERFLEAKASQVLTERMYKDWLKTSMEDDVFSYEGFSIERIKNKSSQQKKWMQITYKTTVNASVKTKKQYIINQDSQ